MKEIRNRVIEKSGHWCKKWLYWYTYCLNNPLKYADPSGEKWKWWHWLIAELLTGGISSTAGITYASIVPSIPAIQGISAIADYASVWIKSWSDPGGAGNRFDNAIKIDLGQIMIFPWEVEQTLIGNAASHFRNLSGKVDNVEISNGSILVNDYDRYDPTDSWGFTLGPYINSKNVEVREDIYYHELGHTIQSRFLGPLYISRIAVPSGFTGFYSYYVWNDYGEYHEKCLYEVWANKLGGPKESSEYPRSFRKNSFWYWWWFIILPSYPN